MNPFFIFSAFLLIFLQSCKEESKNPRNVTNSIRFTINSSYSPNYRVRLFKNYTDWYNLSSPEIDTIFDKNDIYLNQLEGTNYYYFINKMQYVINDNKSYDDLENSGIINNKISLTENKNYHKVINLERDPTFFLSGGESDRRYWQLFKISKSNNTNDSILTDCDQNRFVVFGRNWIGINFFDSYIEGSIYSKCYKTRREFASLDYVSNTNTDGVAIVLLAIVQDKKSFSQESNIWIENQTRLKIGLYKTKDTLIIYKNDMKEYYKLSNEY